MDFAFVSAAPLPCRKLAPTSHTSLNGNRRTSFIPSIRLPATHAMRRNPTVRMTLHNGKHNGEDANSPMPPFSLAWLEAAWPTAKKALSVAALSLLLTLPLTDAVQAARGGGRVGGSSFRAPAMRSAPRAVSPSPYYGGGGGYGYGGAGLFLNPFIMPFGGFGLGFGSLGTFLFVAAIASLLSNVMQSRVASGGDAAFTDAVDADPATTVAVLKVGLLANARQLQVDLDALARSADTTSVSGLSFVLQEAVTSLLRNPDYWAFGSIAVTATPLSRAEGEFNRLALEERLKLDEETLTNTSGRRAEKARAAATTPDLAKAPSEYIVISIVVAAGGAVVRRLPKNVDGVRDVERALKGLASVSASGLQAVEIVWAPQSMRDTLLEQEMLADHPELKRL